MRKGFVVSRWVAVGRSPLRILLIPAPFAPPPPSPPCPWLAITGGGDGVSRGGMGSQSETQLAGAAGISSRPTSDDRPRPSGQVIFFQLEKLFVQRFPFSNFCEDFVRVLRGESSSEERAIKTLGLSLQICPLAFPCSEAGNL